MNDEKRREVRVAVGRSWAGSTKSYHCTALYNMMHVVADEYRISFHDLCDIITELHSIKSEGT